MKGSNQGQISEAIKSVIAEIRSSRGHNVSHIVGGGGGGDPSLLFYWPSNLDKLLSWHPTQLTFLHLMGFMRPDQDVVGARK